MYTNNVQRNRSSLTFFLQTLGSKCETDDIEDDECEINSCTCRVISHQCFPQWSPEYYSDYGSEDQKQCRVDKKDCQIQPDPRSGEKTWTECDESLCFDEFGCKLFSNTIHTSTYDYITQVEISYFFCCSLSYFYK